MGASEVSNGTENGAGGLEAPAIEVLQGIVVENADEFPPAIAQLALVAGEDFV